MCCARGAPDPREAVLLAACWHETDVRCRPGLCRAGRTRQIEAVGALLDEQEQRARRPALGSVRSGRGRGAELRHCVLHRAPSAPEHERHAVGLQKRPVSIM